MSNVVVKNLPRLTLYDILRRRRSNLEVFIKDSGVQSYEGLVILCNKIGVQPPPEEDYKKLQPEPVSSPQDGVVVLEPIDVPVKKPEPETEKLSQPPSEEGAKEEGATSNPPAQKKRRRRKKSSPETTTVLPTENNDIGNGNNE